MLACWLHKFPLLRAPANPKHLKHRSRNTLTSLAAAKPCKSPANPDPRGIVLPCYQGVGLPDQIKSYVKSPVLDLNPSCLVSDAFLRQNVSGVGAKHNANHFQSMTLAMTRFSSIKSNAQSPSRRALIVASTTTDTTCLTYPVRG